MDPLADSPTMAALAQARRILADALVDATDLRRRLAAIAAATDWRSRATEDYRRGVATLEDEFERLTRYIEMADDGLAWAQNDEVSRTLARWL